MGRKVMHPPGYRELDADTTVITQCRLAEFTVPSQLRDHCRIWSLPAGGNL